MGRATNHPGGKEVWHTLRRSKMRAAASMLVLSRTVNGSGVITSATLPSAPDLLTRAHTARATCCPYHKPPWQLTVDL